MRFEHFSQSHILILVITLVVPLLLIRAGRNSPTGTRGRSIALALALLLIVNYIVYATWRVQSGEWALRYDLPLEFCNWSTIVTILALVTANRTLAELSYFWVMSGSIQGVITPDLQVRFPHIYFFIFFVAHSGLVVAALYVVFGLRLYPRPGAVWRTLLYTQAYFLTAFAVDYLLDTNYGYLMRKPAGASVLDHLGPWPFYLLSLQAIGLALVSALYLPFYLRNRTATA